MRTVLVSWLAVLALASDTISPPVASAAVVDFEIPILSGPSVPFDPYVASGVTFSGVVRGLTLVREAAIFNCRGASSTNQLVMSDTYAIWAAPATIRADLIGVLGPPVTAVSVRVGATNGDIVVAWLRLFNASDVLVGSASHYLFLTCPFMSGGTLAAIATEPVAYALISAELQPSVDCLECTSSIAIDDFEFGDATVGTVPATWGSLKLRYR